MISVDVKHHVYLLTYFAVCTEFEARDVTVTHPATWWPLSAVLYWALEGKLEF